MPWPLLWFGDIRHLKAQSRLDNIRNIATSSRRRSASSQISSLLPLYVFMEALNQELNLVACPVVTRLD